MSIREIYNTLLRQHQNGSFVDGETWIVMAEALEKVASRSATHADFWDLNSMALASRERAESRERLTMEESAYVDGEIFFASL